jgi:hypothetical protein
MNERNSFPRRDFLAGSFSSMLAAGAASSFGEESAPTVNAPAKERGFVTRNKILSWTAKSAAGGS